MAFDPEHPGEETGEAWRPTLRVRVVALAAVAAPAAFLFLPVGYRDEVADEVRQALPFLATAVLAAAAMGWLAYSWRAFRRTFYILSVLLALAEVLRTVPAFQSDLAAAQARWLGSPTAFGPK